MKLFLTLILLSATYSVGIRLTIVKPTHQINWVGNQAMICGQHNVRIVVDGKLKHILNNSCVATNEKDKLILIEPE